jgi:hypothetical protein
LIYANRSRARTIRRKIASRKAELLLKEYLSVVQRKQWEKDRSFTVITADGTREYLIQYGMAGNVKLVRCDGELPLSKHNFPIRVGSKFCAHVYHPDGPVPNEDNVLAQKLLIEANEEQFLAMANVTAGV